MEAFIDQRIVVGPFQCNCRLLVCPQTGDAALIDPGDEPQKILDQVQKTRDQLGHQRPLTVKYLFHTHAHLDHIGGTRAVRESLEKKQSQAVPQIYLHSRDLEIYRRLKQQGLFFGFSYDDPLPVDQFFEHEQELKVGSLKFTLVHTPGHSPGSVCLRLHEDSSLRVTESLFSGDTLFQGSVGRTDLWQGSSETMLKSIRQRILTLDEDTRVCPGHGPETTVGIEKRHNPFLV